MPWCSRVLGSERWELLPAGSHFRLHRMAMAIHTLVIPLFLYLSESWTCVLVVFSMDLCLERVAFVYVACCCCSVHQRAVIRDDATQVNDVASQLVRQPVRGDALVLVSNAWEWSEWVRSASRHKSWLMGRISEAWKLHGCLNSEASNELTGDSFGLLSTPSRASSRLRNKAPGGRAPCACCQQWRPAHAATRRAWSNNSELQAQGRGIHAPETPSWDKRTQLMSHGLGSRGMHAADKPYINFAEVGGEQSGGMWSTTQHATPDKHIKKDSSMSRSGSSTAIAEDGQLTNYVSSGESSASELHGVPSESLSASATTTPLFEENGKRQGHKYVSSTCTLIPRETTVQQEVLTFLPRLTWASIPAEILGQVMRRLACQDTVSASGVCRHWRSTSLQDRELLRLLHVRICKHRPFRTSITAPGDFGLQLLSRASRVSLPQIVRVAADIEGNASACMLCADIAEVRGSLNSAAGYWKRAARGSEIKAMYKLGVHFYKGDVHVLGRNAEDAGYWLKRFLKAPGVGNVPCSQTELEHMRSQASLIMGYLHFDGEGLRQDNAAALQHMRVAAEYGSDEASSTLGWMYNTGQFGN